MPTSTLNTVIRELPKNDVMKAVCNQLDKCAKLFQVPNWDEVNSVLLAEWILESYPTEPLDAIVSVLSHPPAGKAWRLTPDTISEWMGIELEKRAMLREREHINQKQLPAPVSELADEYLKQLSDQIAAAPDRKIRPLTASEILEEGQVKKKENPYVPPGREYWVMNQKRIEWARKFHDRDTGERMENWISFEEYLKTDNA